MSSQYIARLTCNGFPCSVLKKSPNTIEVEAHAHAYESESSWGGSYSRADMEYYCPDGWLQWGYDSILCEECNREYSGHEFKIGDPIIFGHDSCCGIITDIILPVRPGELAKYCVLTNNKKITLPVYSFALKKV